MTETVVDARFEVLSSPFSLLSASISASQNLYTRKGTLVGFNGKPENVGLILNTLARSSLILLLGHLNPLPPRTSSTSVPRSAIHLPASDIHNTLHCLDLYKVGDHFYGHRASRWKTGLDGDTEERAVGMDWTHIELVASREHQHGKGNED